MIKVTLIAPAIELAQIHPVFINAQNIVKIVSLALTHPLRSADLAPEWDKKGWLE